MWQIPWYVRRNMYLLHLPAQRDDAIYPLIPELIVVVYRIVTACLEQRGLLRDYLRRRRLHCTVGLEATDHALSHPRRRCYAEYPSSVLGKGDLPRLLEDLVQR